MIVFNKLMIVFKRGQWFCLCLAVVLIWFSHQAHAGEDVLNFNILESYPFAYTNDAGQQVGTYWEYVAAIAERSGLNIHRHVVPKPRVVARLKNGEADAAILFRAENLNDFVDYVEPVRTVPIIVATLKTHPVKNYNDLHALPSVGVFHAAAISPAFDADTLINKISIASYPALVGMLGRKRLTAIAGNGVVIGELVRRLCQSNEIEISPLSLGSLEQWLVFSKNSPRQEKIEAIRAAVLSLKKDGVLDQIFDRHFQRAESDCGLMLLAP